MSHLRWYWIVVCSASLLITACLDLAIPIDLYKQNQIAEVVPVQIKVATNNNFFEEGERNYKLGNKQEAIDDYDLAIKINPNYSDAYYNRGTAKSDLGNKREAIADYEKAAELYSKQGKEKDYQDAVNAIKNLGI